MRRGLMAAAIALLALGCGDRSPRDDGNDQLGEMASGEPTEAPVVAIPVEDTLARSRLLQAAPLKCSDGTEVMASYWDVPAARVVLSSHQGLSGVLPRIPGGDDEVGMHYGDGLTTWHFLGDSAVYQAGSRRLTCRPADDVVF